MEQLKKKKHNIAKGEREYYRCGPCHIPSYSFGLLTLPSLTMTMSTIEAPVTDTQECTFSRASTWRRRRRIGGTPPSAERRQKPQNTASQVYFQTRIFLS